jgi:hypothetical protein
VGVAIVGKLEEGIGEGAAGDFAVDVFAAVLAQGVSELAGRQRSAKDQTDRTRRDGGALTSRV